jgi:hypothetical protein
MVRAVAALALLCAIGAGSASRRLGEAGVQVCPAGQVIDPLEERTFAKSASECPSGRIGVTARSNRKV